MELALVVAGGVITAVSLIGVAAVLGGFVDVKLAERKTRRQEAAIIRFWPWNEGSV